MDPTAAMDQIKAEIENATPEQRADMALLLFEGTVGSGHVEALLGTGVTAILARQAVILDRLERIEAKLDGEKSEL